ncbi:MAG: BT4734/BF3469 family protein, partial [Verrucomicrobiota bacterium]
MNKLVVSMVSNATAITTSDGNVASIIKGIQNGKWRGQIEKIRSEVSRVQHETGDPKAAKVAVGPLKKMLPGAMWSGRFSSRKKPAAGNLLAHSGLLCADLDDLGERLSEVRTKLATSPHLFSLFTSPTNNGLKALFRVPTDAAKHPDSFRAVRQHVLELTEEEIDPACSDVSRICFVSYDPEALIKENVFEIPLLAETAEKKAPASGFAQTKATAAPEGDMRRTIAEKILGPIDWDAEGHGLCICPGQR